MANTKNPMAGLVGNNIKKERTRQRLSQRELADAIHVTVATLSRIENGVHYPSERNLEAIARILKKPKDSFFKKDDEPLPQSASVRKEDYEKALMEVGSLRSEVESLKQQLADYTNKKEVIDQISKDSLSVFCARSLYDVMLGIGDSIKISESAWRSFLDHAGIDYEAVKLSWDAFRSTPKDILKKK